MIDATHLKAHRTAASPLKKGSTPRYRTQPGRADYQTAGGLRRQGAAAAAASERGTGQRSQDRRRRSRAGTARQLLLADRAYSSVGFRQALADRGITPCIPPHAKHRTKHVYDPVLYLQRHKIENMFARLKDWRRIHSRYDRCAHTFLSAIAFAAAFIFWINEPDPS